jgi:peptidoglycan/LPS O-acetylase OafA/YrhL
MMVLFAKRDEATLSWALRSFFFLPIPDGRLPVVSVTWMLSMFVLFYWIFSVAFLARREWVLAPIFAIWALGIVAYTWLNWRPNLEPRWSILFFQGRNLDFILGYIVGVVLRRKMLTLNAGRAVFWAGVAGLVIGTTLLNTAPPSHAIRLFVGVATALFTLGLATMEQNRAPDWVVRAITTPWLVWLGATSYVLYLTHNLFFQAWGAVLPVTPLLVPIITLGAILVGAIGYRYWEAPILAYLKTRYGLRLG